MSRDNDHNVLDIQTETKTAERQTWRRRTGWS